jgi:hypothetical protein
LRLADHLSCTTRKRSDLVEVEQQMDEV